MLIKFIPIYVTLTIVSGRESKYKYPEVWRYSNLFDSYGSGTKVWDPYRHLEDISSIETQEFVQLQNRISEDFLNEAPSRSKIKEVLTRLYNYAEEGVPSKRGQYYFVLRNPGGKNHQILYKGRTVESIYYQDATVLINPNELATDGTVALKDVSFSKNGELLSYLLSKSGSDWTEIHLMNTTSGEEFIDEILSNTKYTATAWTHDNAGFFYTGFDNTNIERIGSKTLDTRPTEHEKIYYHRVGTRQEMDILIAHFPENPTWGHSIQVSHDGQYAIVYSSDVINEEYVFYCKLDRQITGQITLLPLITKPAYYSYITNDGPTFYFVTNDEAPNNKVVAINVNAPNKSKWRTVIAEDVHKIIDWTLPIAKDKLVISYLRDVKSTLQINELKSGKFLREYSLPVGSIQKYSGRREDYTFYYQLESFTNPGEIYRLDFHKNGNIPKEAKLQRRISPTGVDPSKLETRQLFFKSTDGTNVPMFIVKRKSLVPNRETPCLMYGYGGFASSYKPFYSATNVGFVGMFDGIFVLVNIRGGGEFGAKWWNDGKLLKKTNSFEDFIRAGQHLIALNYTRPEKLTIMGASNGGLLVAAVANKRPDLFGAVIAQVGVMDMLRFQYFTGGAYWCGEYGCSQNSTHFQNLIRYSPLHNIRPNTKYPAIFVTTADHDDRVIPSHSYKYISQLQYIVGNYQFQEQPLMLRVYKDAGHGAGTPTWKKIEQIVDIFSFLQLTLRIHPNENCRCLTAGSDRFVVPIFSLSFVAILQMHWKYYL